MQLQQETPTRVKTVCVWLRPAGGARFHLVLPAESPPRGGTWAWHRLQLQGGGCKCKLHTAVGTDGAEGTTRSAGDTALQEIDEDLTAEADNIQVISEEEREELKVELDKLEDEIATLRQVLAAKEKYLMEIKQKLGMNRMNELKQNFSKSWHDVQTYSAYKKTQETLSHAGQKATAAISNVGSAIGKKLGDMRNSPTFKSFEERVENTMTNFKTRVGGTGPSGGNFEEVLNSAAHASAQSSVLESRLPESEEELQC